MTEENSPESATTEPNDVDGPVPPRDASTLTKFESLAFFTADYAAVESGKVYASGAFWTTLRFPGFPAVLPAMALVAIIKVPFHANFADHDLTVTLVDSDGSPMGMRIEGKFRSAPTVDSQFGAPGVSPVAFPIHGLTFARPGEHTFVLGVDEEKIARYTVNVIQVANIPVPAGPTPPPE